MPVYVRSHLVEDASGAQFYVYEFRFTAAYLVACLEGALSSSKVGSPSNWSMRTRSLSFQPVRRCAACPDAKDRLAYLTGRDHHDVTLSAPHVQLRRLRAMSCFGVPR